MSELESVEQELREIANNNIRDMGPRGELANELLSRLNERNVEGGLASIGERIENALGLLATSAFTFTQQDAKQVINGLSEICNSEFSDAIFIDPETERTISLLKNSPALAEDEARLRVVFRDLVGRLEIDFADDFGVMNRPLDDEPPEDPTPIPGRG